MTINVNTSRNEYTATSGQTVFNFTFKIYTATDLNVYVTPAGQECNDVTDLTEDYTVTGVGLEDGGSITLNTGAGENDLVTIASAIPTSRTTDYQSNGDFTQETVNNDIDRAISLIKQVESKANRSLLSSECLQGPKPLTLPNPEPGEFIRWKADVSGLENVPGSAIAEEVIVETDYAIAASAASAAAALVSEGNAATSETNAATSETNAATSETNAAASATSASSSASSASSSASSAAGSATTATTKASEASTSASNASTSETNASNSASAASTSANNASTSESNAATSATNAASSASAAATSATEAAASAASIDTSSFVVKSNNLSDLDSASTALTNLGIANHDDITVDGSGIVGIGTSSPSSLLHLVKAGATAYSATATDGQVGVGPTIYLENPSNSNTSVGGQIVFGMRSTEEQARIGATGGTGPALTFGTADAERMRIDSSGQLKTMLTNGTAVMDAYTCRAWVDFNGTDTVAIRASGNVSSITDRGTGQYTVNLTNNMGNANYATLATAQDATEGSTRIAHARPNYWASYYISVENTGSTFIDTEWISSCVLQ